LACVLAAASALTGCGLPLVPADPPPPPSARLTVGAHHTCAEGYSDSPTRHLVCWGDNTSGQLGDGTTTSRSTAVDVVGVDGVGEVEAGGDRTCAITSGTVSTVLCWGDNAHGGLGDGTTTNRSTPTPVVGLPAGHVGSLAVGETFACVLPEGTEIMCWGEVPGVPGGYTTTPVVLPGVSSFRYSIGRHHICGEGHLEDSDQQGVWCIGDNSAGQLGDGTTTSSATPVGVVGLPPSPDPHLLSTIPQQIVAAGDHTCVVYSQFATVYCWGDNSSGQLGDGTTTDRAVPTAVPVPGGVTGDPMVVSLGEAFTCVQPASVDRGCFGDNGSGQFGNGTTTSSSSSSSFVAVRPSIGEWWEAGGAHQCQLGGHPTTDQYTVTCWGDNAFGQLGDGTTASSSLPVSVMGL
jgi:alpha-tubulin suppressor-like RCC1 family protein